MIKVTALTSGKHAPASRFRVRQFIAPLSERGIGVSEFHPPWSKYTLASVVPLGVLGRLPGVANARVSDITWLERELIPGRFTLERYAGRRRLFDVDDAIWLLSETRFSERIAELCDGVIAGNQYIADHYRAHGARRTWVVPTSIDTDLWRPGTRLRESASWTIGWIGSQSNLPYLYEIEEPLADFLNGHGDAQLLVVCDREPAFKKIGGRALRFERWSPASEIGLVQEMDVGLMPLPLTEWTLGKCAFKMISYMAVGIPVVVSPVGVNREVLEQASVGFGADTRDEWYDALRLLYEDRGLGPKMGVAGRRLVEDRYSVNSNVVALADIFREVAGR
ncbi:MAG TPA: glycosyltransferase family 4 protein [Pyrinomonadaceae bacterium]|jgi:glycosyltransferase involved in cell wall biosynthesis